MNDRQKADVTRALVNGAVTSGWCRKELPVAYDLIRRDLLELVKLSNLEQNGKGRSTRVSPVLLPLLTCSPQFRMIPAMKVLLQVGLTERVPIPLEKGGVMHQAI